MTKILFICHGNICRSTMAEALCKHYVEEKGIGENFAIESAATSREEIGNSPDRRTLKVLEENKIPAFYLNGKKARQVRADEYDYWDIFICMDDNNMKNIRNIFKDDKSNKVFKISELTDKVVGNVADPWYTGDFDTTFRELNLAIKDIVENMLEN